MRQSTQRGTSVLMVEILYYKWNQCVPEDPELLESESLEESESLLSLPEDEESDDEDEEEEESESDDSTSWFWVMIILGAFFRCSLNSSLLEREGGWGTVGQPTVGVNQNHGWLANSVPEPMGRYRLNDRP